MLYFAYGSNMCNARIQRRVPSARVVQSVSLSGYRFRFHKRSFDGSGKGNAFRTGNPQDIVRGVLFDIDSREKPDLDLAEGLGRGYVEVPVTVSDREGNQRQAFTYIAESSAVDDKLRPYTWYKHFVVEGAREHDLPIEYITEIETMSSIEDPNKERDAKNSAIAC